jgi:hypothetical protein
MVATMENEAIVVTHCLQQWEPTSLFNTPLQQWVQRPLLEYIVKTTETKVIVGAHYYYFGTIL